LRRFQEDVREVRTGFECGITVEGFQALQPGDIIQAYRKERAS
jgi:translation initiation factor IF-2